MKALIIISSWIGKEPSVTQAMRNSVRETFLKDIHKFPELEYKFFMGDGTPTGEDESFIYDTISNVVFDQNYKEKAKRCVTGLEVSTYIPKDDEVILNVPDDYYHITYKMRAEHRWAVENNYDFMFQTSGDIYINLKNLMSSGFESHDYVGLSIPSNGLYPNVTHYAGGSVGYWLSNKASRIVVNSPVDFWCDDIWAGQRMFLNNIPLFSDHRYGTSITKHLGDMGEGTFGTYDPKYMYKAHEEK